MNINFWRSFTNMEEKIWIVDIGASRLWYEAGYKQLLDMGVANVTGFEPNPEEYENLLKLAGENESYIEAFIGKGGPATYYETNLSHTGSLYKPNFELINKFQNLSELMAVERETTVQTSSLDSFLSLPVDFLKIDVQGAELDVLQGAQSKLEETLAIQVEVEFLEIYEKQPLFSEIDQFLRRKGFIFHCFEGDISGRAFKPFLKNGDPNAKLNQGIWTDACYVKSWMDLTKLDNLQLCKLAVICAAVFRSPDLAYVFLKELDRRLNADFSSSFLEGIAKN